MAQAHDLGRSGGAIVGRHAWRELCEGFVPMLLVGPRTSRDLDSMTSPLKVVVNIQVLRCFAAMSVVWHHLQARMNTELGAPFLGFTGMAGVDVFFVISGFIMFHTTQGADNSTSRFWTDRAIRIAPFYWIATLLSVALYTLGLHPDLVTKLDVSNVVAALGFFPEIRADGSHYPVLDVGWTLIFEAYFYLLFGLTFFMKSQSRAVAALAVVFLVSAIYRSLTPGLPFAMEFYFRPITLEFVGGGLLALAYRSSWLAAMPRSRLISLGWVLLAGGVAALLLTGWRVGWRFWQLNGEFELRVLAFGVPSLLIVAGALLLERADQVWKSRTMLLLGAASYSIYISHQFVVGMCESVVHVFYPQISLGTDLVTIAVGLVAAATIGVLIHLNVEKPLAAAMKRAVRGRSRAAAGTLAVLTR
jgi:exopolysaccharide production protein ExoZ